MTKSHLSRVSLTGAEDSVEPGRLFDLSASYPEVEWALLATLEHEGSGRNPSQAWREFFLDGAQQVGARTALHLCGKDAFERVLSEPCWHELARYGRVQANLNSRSETFDKAQAMRIWDKIANTAKVLIIQLHERSESWAMEFLSGAGRGACVEVLFDESKGRGVSPEAWRDSLPGVACGYAGGLGPQNVGEQLPLIMRAAHEPGCWIDMETNIRTGNFLDVDKCRSVLERAAPFIDRS